MAWSDEARAAALAVRRMHKTATTARSTPRGVHVRYHNTDVVSFGRRAVILRTGGWATTTTKRRMNEMSRKFGLGYNVYQQHYNWYVSTPKQGTLPMGRTIKFKR